MGLNQSEFITFIVVWRLLWGFF